MSDFNFIRWRIKLRTRRKRNRVKRIKNEEVMAVSVKTGIVELSCRPADAVATVNYGVHRNLRYILDAGRRSSIIEEPNTIKIHASAYCKSIFLKTTNFVTLGGVLGNCERFN
ncbi:hypothetical protein Hanom_Chr04g00381011 [Helianthus anomalus]